MERPYRNQCAVMGPYLGGQWPGEIAVQMEIFIENQNVNTK